MKTEQIKAIKDVMDMLTDLQEAASMMTSLDNYQEFTNKYIRALRESNIDNSIVEHFRSICKSYLPIAEDAVRQHIRYIECYEEEREWEMIELEKKLTGITD